MYLGFIKCFWIVTSRGFVDLHLIFNIQIFVKLLLYNPNFDFQDVFDRRWSQVACDNLLSG
jgi:hypothetical protein